MLRQRSSIRLRRVGNRKRAFFTTGAGGYSPLSDTTLTLWLSRNGPFAANIDGTGGTPAPTLPCGRWGDISGLGNHFSASANDSTRPVLHGNGVGFGLIFTAASSQQLLGLSTLAMTAAWTLFVRYNSTQVGSNNGIIGRWNPAGGNQWVILTRGAFTAGNQEGITRNAADNGFFVASTPSVDDGSTHVIGLQWSPATNTVRTWTDSTEATDATAVTIHNVTGNVIIGRNADGGNYFNGVITDVLLYMRDFTLADRNQVRTYLG